MTNRKQRRASEAEARKVPAGPDAEVCIAIPSGSHWYGEFAMCVIQMMLDTLGHPTPGFGLISANIRNVRGSLIWKQRADLVQGALDAGCTHLLFVDTDQVFPANTLRRLIHHKKPVVAANVAIKQFPSMATARKMINGEVQPVFTTPESKGLEEVWRIGTGVMMIDLAIMAKVEKPWFKVSWGDESAQYGEDWWFCSQVESAGFPIYIDHDLSREVGHIGSMVYTHDHIPPEVIAETAKIFADGSDAEKESVLSAVTKRLQEGA